MLHGLRGGCAEGADGSVLLGGRVFVFASEFAEETSGEGEVLLLFDELGFRGQGS